MTQHKGLLHVDSNWMACEELKADKEDSYTSADMVTDISFGHPVK